MKQLLAVVMLICTCARAQTASMNDSEREIIPAKADGKAVPIGSVARIEDSTGPVLINRYNTYPAAVINGAAYTGVDKAESSEALYGNKDYFWPGAGTARVDINVCWENPGAATATWRAQSA